MTYKEKKEKARQFAMNWQNNFYKMTYDWQAVIQWNERWQKIGRKYGLVKEFKENGVI